MAHDERLSQYQTSAYHEFYSVDFFMRRTAKFVFSITIRGVFRISLNIYDGAFFYENI